MYYPQPIVYIVRGQKGAGRAGQMLKVAIHSSLYTAAGFCRGSTPWGSTAQVCPVCLAVVARDRPPIILQKFPIILFLDSPVFILLFLYSYISYYSYGYSTSNCRIQISSSNYYVLDSSSALALTSIMTAQCTVYRAMQLITCIQ